MSDDIFKELFDVLRQERTSQVFGEFPYLLLTKVKDNSLELSKLHDEASEKLLANLRQTLRTIFELREKKIIAVAQMSVRARTTPDTERLSSVEKEYLADLQKFFAEKRQVCIEKRVMELTPEPAANSGLFNN